MYSGFLCFPIHAHRVSRCALQIIFPEAHWVGTREENPTEKELPMPAELQSAVKHEKYSFGSEVNQTGKAPPSHLFCVEHDVMLQAVTVI